MAVISALGRAGLRPCTAPDRFHRLAAKTGPSCTSAARWTDFRADTIQDFREKEPGATSFNWRQLSIAADGVLSTDLRRNICRRDLEVPGQPGSLRGYHGGPGHVRRGGTRFTTPVHRARRSSYQTRSSMMFGHRRRSTDESFLRFFFSTFASTVDRAALRGLGTEVGNLFASGLNEAGAWRAQNSRLGRGRARVQPRVFQLFLPRAFWTDGLGEDPEIVAMSGFVLPLGEPKAGFCRRGASGRIFEGASVRRNRVW